jgi:CHASE3 domain sensor protein
MKGFRIFALVATMALGLTVGAYAQSEKSATSTQQNQSTASSTSTAAEHIQDAMNDTGGN